MNFTNSKYTVNMYVSHHYHSLISKITTRINMNKHKRSFSHSFVSSILFFFYFSLLYIQTHSKLNKQKYSIKNKQKKLNLKSDIHNVKIIHLKTILYKLKIIKNQRK